MRFQTYIQNSPISQNFKELILNVDFLNNNPEFYKNYPSLFSNVFLINAKQLDLLDIAGYLYYQSTIFSDSLIDEKDISKFPLITICQEESIKILSNIYNLKSDFWRLWNIRRNEYFNAIYFEKELSNKLNIDIEEYEVLADAKSSFGKVAIDCLYSLDNKNEEIYKKLLLSHKYFSVAFQLNDDIQDFKKDFENNQFNWAIYQLKQQNIKNHDSNILEKYLYLRGISKKMYLLGINYCDKSLNIIENIEIPKWKKVVCDTKKTFTNAIIEIENYIEIITSDVSLSNIGFLDNNLQNSKLSAIKFIKSKQEDNGSWREYINQGGISNIWATAFITSKISESKKLRAIFKNEIIKSLNFLNVNNDQLLWSYNNTWIEDADSTNFVFLSLFNNALLIKNEILERWLLYQTKKGGFSTYLNKEHLLTSLDDKNITNVNGWLFNHNCVSAVSFYFLAQHNQKAVSFITLKKYFDKRFKNQIYSYWWTSSIYTYYYLVKTYQYLSDSEKVIYIMSKISNIQNDNGSFSDIYGENLFYTGLALEILLLDPSRNKKQIEKTILFLYQNQFDDGSWENSNALQVPNSKDTIPSKEYFPISNFGMNVRAKEFNRLFTTTTILHSLSIYEEKYSTITF
jgi:hypothetical protein